MSVRKADTPYTCAGFGDRVHSCMIAYLYGKAHMDEPVTLHVTDAMMNRPDKVQSWHDILELFPAGSVQLSHEPHAQTYYYGDTLGMHPYDKAEGIDIAPYLKVAPMLKPIDCSADIKLPTKPYATMQWDAGGKPWSKKRLNPDQQARVIRRYRDEGLALVTVGREATNPLLSTSPKHVGYLMAHAELHIGVDSGPMHLASLYMIPQQLHIYPARAMSHHVVRWLANGAVRDRHL